MGSIGLGISRKTASLKATWARLAFVTGLGQVLWHQDERHPSDSVSDQGEGVAVDKCKEVLFGGTREHFCPHKGYHIPLALCYPWIVTGQRTLSVPMRGNLLVGVSIISAIGDPHGLQAWLGGSAGDHLAMHKHLFRSLLRRREVSLLVKARQDLLGLSRAWLKG